MASASSAGSRFSLPVAQDVDLQMPLLWALRENLLLSGTKFGSSATPSLRAGS